MSVKAVVKMGNQQLATPSVSIMDFSDPSLEMIIADMRDTLLEKEGVGIAAPQIGYNVRIIMFGFDSNPRYPNEPAIPLTILINPEIHILSDEMVDGWEGCLSVPGLRGLVPRYQKIQYQGYDVNGSFIKRVAEGFHARVVQHECDHLDGVLYPSRIKNIQNFGFEDESEGMMLKQKKSSSRASFNTVLNNTLFLDRLGSRLIKVISPASGLSPEKIEQLQTLSELNVEFPPMIINRDIPFHASDDNERFEQLRNALYDDSKNTILWTLRGGYGSARLIDRLSALPRPTHEKIFIGFSDNTALHLFLSQQWHWKTIHAAGFAQLLDPNQDPQNYMRIAEIIANYSSISLLSNLKPFNKLANTPNTIRGHLTGGNLTLVETSIGTPWQIQTTNKIMFLEETGEKGYRIDRSLNHLRQAGLLKDVKAIIFGEFMHDVERYEIDIALERFAKETAIPMYKTDQFGHGKMNYPLIYNTLSELSPTNDKHYDLRTNPRDDKDMT